MQGIPIRITLLLVLVLLPLALFADRLDTTDVLESQALIVSVVPKTKSQEQDRRQAQQKVAKIQNTLADQGFVITTALIPEREALDEVLRSFAQQQGAARFARLLIYFAGEISTQSTENEGMLFNALVPYGAQADFGVYSQEEVLPLESLQRHILDVATHELLLVFEGCPTGSSIFRHVSDANYPYKQGRLRENHQVLALCTEYAGTDAPVNADTLLSSALSGDADSNQDQEVSLPELYAFAQKMLGSNYVDIPYMGYFHSSSPGDPERVRFATTSVEPLGAEKAWQLIDKRGSWRDFEAFSQKYPNSKRAAQASALATQRKDQRQIIFNDHTNFDEQQYWQKFLEDRTAVGPTLDYLAQVDSPYTPIIYRNLANLMRSNTFDAKTNKTIYRLCRNNRENDSFAMLCHASAMYNLWGNISKDEVLKWVQRSAEQNNDYALLELGTVSVSDSFGEQNTALAERYFLGAALRGNRYAQSALGTLYANGPQELRNETKSVKWYRNAGLHGETKALVGLGWFYETGLGGLAQNHDKAASLYRIAANYGDPDGQTMLKNLFVWRKSRIKRDPNRALLLRRAVENQSPSRKTKKDSLSNAQIGAPQFLQTEGEKDFSWLQENGEAGSIAAQLMLGYVYENKDNPYQVAVDAMQSFFWYKKAAEQGSRQAQIIVGNMYLYGKGTLQSQESAFSWFKKAALRNDDKGINNIAWFYEHGIIVRQDFIKSYLLYKRASQLGNAKSPLNLWRLKRRMTPAQHQRAQKIEEDLDAMSIQQIETTSF